MKKNYTIVIRGILIFFFVLAFGIGVTILIGGLQGKPPEQLLDFQDVTETALDKPIYSVDDGMPYALNRALEWRDDAVLTSMQIVSVGKEDILSNKGKFNYIFEYEYIDENKPAGILSVSINTKSNSIELVSAFHDGEDRTRKVKELKVKNLAENIGTISDIAIKTIGIERVFQYDQPIVSIRIDSDFAIFEINNSQIEPSKIENRVKIDMKTFSIIN